MPVTTPAYFCEGEEIPTLDNFVAISTANKPATAYSLLWYGQTEPSDDEKPNGSTTPSAAPSTAISDGETHRYIYYVAQRDEQTGAIGTPSQLIITVYPKPIINVIKTIHFLNPY